MPSPSARFASTIAKLEDLPSDGGRAVDTLAGANLRIFVRLEELEAAVVRVARRVAALEGSGADLALVLAADREEAPVASPVAAEAVTPDQVRGRLYTLGEASRACGRAKRSISRAIETGRLPAAKSDDGKWAIDPAELRRVYP